MPIGLISQSSDTATGPQAGIAADASAEVQPGISTVSKRARDPTQDLQRSIHAVNQSSLWGASRAVDGVGTLTPNRNPQQCPSSPRDSDASIRLDQPRRPSASTTKRARMESPIPLEEAESRSTAGAADNQLSQPSALATRSSSATHATKATQPRRSLAVLASRIATSSASSNANLPGLYHKTKRPATPTAIR